MNITLNKNINFGQNKKIFVIGHQNPDADSICSSIGYSYLKIKTGSGSEVYPLLSGELNAETEFILNYFNIKSPRRIESSDSSQNFILVDHNNKSHITKDVYRKR